MSEHNHENCNHDHSHDEEIVEDGIIHLVDDEGTEVAFEILLTFDHGAHFYASLLPVEPLEGFEEGEVLIMRIDEDVEQEVSTFSPVETEEELDAVWNTFIELYNEGEEEA